MLIKQVSIRLLSFIALATKFLSLNNESSIFRPSLTDLNSVEPKYYPFMAILDKFSGSCHSANEVSTKTCVTNKTKVFIIIARLNE